MNKVEYFKKLLKDKYVKAQDLAKLLNYLSTSSIYNKINGGLDFKGSEIDKIKDYLKLSKTEFLKCFYDVDIEETEYTEDITEEQEKTTIEAIEPIQVIEYEEQKEQQTNSNYLANKLSELIKVSDLVIKLNENIKELRTTV